MKARHDAGTASFSGFARAINCKPSYVTELKAAGRLVLTEDGKRVRVTPSLALMRETADPARAGVAARHAAKREQGAAITATGSPTPASGPDEGDEQYPDTSGYADPVTDSHARRRAKAQADKAEADTRKALRDEKIELGQLLQAEEVEHAVRGAVVAFRGALENLPNTIAPELSAITDEGRVRVVLAEALEHALGELARRFGAIARTEDA